MTNTPSDTPTPASFESDSSDSSTPRQDSLRERVGVGNPIEIRMPQSKLDSWLKRIEVVSVVLIAGGLGLLSYLQKTESDRAQMQQAASDTHLRNIELVQGFMPHLKEDGPNRYAALRAMRELSTFELATTFAVLYGGEGSADFLTEMAFRSNDAHERSEAREAYEYVCRQFPELICSQNGYDTETIPTPIMVGVRVDEQSPYTYTISVNRPEIRERITVQKDPETGELIRDESGKIKTQTETYTVSIPYLEERQASRIASKTIFQEEVVDRLMAMPKEKGEKELDQLLQDALADGPRDVDEVHEEVANKMGILQDWRLFKNLRREILWRVAGSGNINQVQLRDAVIGSVGFEPPSYQASERFTNRSWHRANGGRIGLARVVFRYGSTVTLESENGVLITEQYPKLSIQDQTYIDALPPKMVVGAPTDVPTLTAMENSESDPDESYKVDVKTAVPPSHSIPPAEPAPAPPSDE